MSNNSGSSSIVSGVAVLEEGYRCSFSEGETTLVVDLPEGSGGTGQGPAPGVLGRAALASCIAMGIQSKAASNGIKLSRLSVLVSQEFDDLAGSGTPGHPDLPIGTSLNVEIGGDRADASLEALVHEALTHDVWFLCYAEQQRVQVNVQT